ncbi:MAG: uracil-DNA glycosylase [Desulfuromonadales bacterium]|nr:uracil-DNA glycosylase [Desulfuromonadales bacterium]
MPDQLQKSLSTTLNEVRAWLEDLRALGLHDLQVADLRELQPCPPGIVGLDRGGDFGCRQETLEEIRADLGDCQRCPLCNSRTQIVFGEGAASASIVFVGGAVSKLDDTTGQPLASELFDRILFAMGLDRSSVYTCEVVMCRSEHRSPHQDEIATCLPFLQRQLAVIAPRIIVAMGEIATRVLTGEDEEFSRLRGRWFKYQELDVMPTFDPAYLLLHPHEKREAWNDIKEVLQRMRQED